jgi:hypothetical protein
VSTQTFIQKWGGSKETIIDSLHYANADECVVLFELVQDWIYVRNALSVCARLLGQLESGNGVSLADAGFESHKSKRLNSKKLFGLPLKYNTMLSIGLLKWDIEDPLFYNTVEREKEDSNIFSYKVTVNYLKAQDKSVFLTTAPVATNKPYSLRKSLKNQPSEEKTFFLCVEDTGSQEQMAKNIVSQFAAVFRNLEMKQKGVSGSEQKFGWVYDESGEFENLAQPKMMPLSLASALWLRLVYHPSRKITLCKKCGNAVLSKEQGMPREFCSNSCRVQFGNESRQR